LNKSHSQNNDGGTTMTNSLQEIVTAHHEDDLLYGDSGDSNYSGEQNLHKIVHVVRIQSIINHKLTQSILHSQNNFNSTQRTLTLKTFILPLIASSIASLIVMWF